jgi:hypothetical protein
MLHTFDKTVLSPLLFENGFKKRGLTWNRGSGEIVQVLDLQKSKFSDAERIDFTINVGIWARPVWMVLSGATPPRFIKESDCYTSFRVGQLLADFCPKATDLWWILTNENDVERVGVEVRTIVSDKCLPFLDRFRSLEDVKQFYDSTELRLMPGEKLYCAVLNHLLGDHAAYDRLMADFKDKKLSAWQPRVAEVTQRLQNVPKGPSTY